MEYGGRAGQVIGFVSDESRWKFIQEAAGKDLFDKLAFVR
jgi:hypothetical protein